MSSPAIAKEVLTAYQRWELDSFDAPKEVPLGGASKKVHLGGARKEAPLGGAPTRGRAAVLPPTVDQLERMHQQAHDEGYTEGHRQGRDQVAKEAERMRQLVAALTQASQQFDQRLADELLGLALAISRQILRQALRLHPELILAVVNEMLGQLSLSRQRARLILHPEDAALVRLSLAERIQQTGLEVLEDAQLSRGGCRLEATECEIDATLERRWERVMNAIGSEHAWTE